MTTNQPSNDQSHSNAEGHLPATGDQSLTNKPNELQTRPIASFQSINIFELETFKFQQINAECQRRTLPLPSQPTKALLIEILLTDNLRQQSPIIKPAVYPMTNSPPSIATIPTSTSILPPDKAILLQTANKAILTLTAL